MSQENSVRIKILSLLVLLCAIFFVGRLYSLQIIEGQKFKAAAEKQYVNTNTVAYDRGEIYFESRSRELVPAAMTRSGFTLAINPSLINDPEKNFTSLNQLVTLDKNDFLAKATKKGDPYEEIALKINNETANKIKALKIPGVFLATEKWRFYPGQDSAARIIGFVSFKGKELVGSYGLEKYYDDILTRKTESAYHNFFAQIFSNIKDTVKGDPLRGNLVSTIEPTVQSNLEENLKKLRKDWASDMAGGIIINPQNGEIYAIGLEPSFDLNDFRNVENPSIFSNPLVESVFEMGSIIKPLTLAGGIDSGVITSTSTYYDAGFLFLNNKRIENYDGKGRGRVGMQEILNQSLNTGAAYVAMKMGNDKFSKYMKSFGIGTETGIDLPGETKGLIKNLDSQRDIEIATASYGQGIAMTPIETVRALSTLANKGILITPHIIKRIEYPSGLFKKITYESETRVLKEETSEEITRMLVKVVDDALVGGKVKLPDYSVAAKTGTAQMINEGQAGYAEGKYLHSFFGYFPAYDAKFFVFLFHTHPKNVRYASETLTEPFMDITKFLINYYEIPPDRGITNEANI